MQLRVENCPDGVAIVVPKAIADSAGLRGGEQVNLELVGNQLIVRQSSPRSLAELLAGITPENIHGEWDTGSPIGAEML